MGVRITHKILAGNIVPRDLLGIPETVRGDRFTSTVDVVVENCYASICKDSGIRGGIESLEVTITIWQSEEKKVRITEQKISFTPDLTSPSDWISQAWAAAKIQFPDTYGAGVDVFEEGQ